MNTDFWASRLAAAKRQYALQHHHNSSQLGLVFLLISMDVRLLFSQENWAFFFLFFFLVSVFHFWVRSVEHRWFRGWGRGPSRFSLSVLLRGLRHRLSVFASRRRALVRIKSHCTWVCFSFLLKGLFLSFFWRDKLFMFEICGWFLWFGFCSIFMNPVLILAYCSFFILSFMSGPNSSYLFASNGLIYFWFYSRYVIFCFGKWAKARIYPSVVSFCFHLCLRVLQKLLPSWSNPMNIAVWLAFGNPQRGLIRC